MIPKTVRGNPKQMTVFATFSESLFFHAFWSPVGSILAHFWLTFGSRWLPFGSLWLPFGSLLAPSGSLLVLFWFRLVVFFNTWIHWAPFHLLAIPFDSFLWPVCIFWQTFVLFLIQRRSDPINCLPIPACPIPRDPLGCKLAFQGPEREYCRRQLKWFWTDFRFSRGPKTDPLGDIFTQQSDFGVVLLSGRSTMEPTWSRFGAENAPRTYFHRSGVVFDHFGRILQWIFDAIVRNFDTVFT